MRYEVDLGNYPEKSRAKKFYFEWDDPDRLTIIFGHHLIFIGSCSCILCATNTTIYTTDLYGDALKLEFEFAPYFTDTANTLPAEMHNARAWLLNVHFCLGFFCL